MTPESGKPKGRRPRVLLYVQHLLGIGHLKRAALLSRALGCAGAEVTFVSGGAPQQDLDIGGARLVQLAPCHVRDESFALLDAEGRPVSDAWRNQRRDHLLSLLRDCRPDALLIELFPFGRRQMRFELLPLLEAASASSHRPLVFCSVRDLLSKVPTEERQDWIVALLERYFDRVLVHGDPAFLPFDGSFPASASLGSKLLYTGYVTAAPADSGQGRNGGHNGERSGEVLVSTGGGAVAGPLLEAALAARPLTSLAKAPWRLLAGNNFPETAFQALKERLPKGVTLERSRPDFQELLRACRLSISQAGYNTTLEVLAAGVRAVLVPYAAGEEGEQRLRAGLLAEQGLLTLVAEETLSGQSLAAGIERELARERPSETARLDLDGADKSAAAILAALAARRKSP